MENVVNGNEGVMNNGPYTSVNVYPHGVLARGCDKSRTIADVVKSDPYMCYVE